ncbi:SnoaL-like protein [Paraburkholderia sp. RAU2J]|uniref:nuclear transport factor 2 family protein n=1 Tax=Paraburkholderia sp. RAU2J TaxID=1938810 RepID=UPI000EAD96EC|nr:nuclear transport factor 2 family protein [Paraburkholderia sp. RAU2J]RKT14141.1 SnoaL-like protein [Paraburkholderia sp. RAU2J]
MRPELEKRLEELLDRQAILDCIHRYCRGVDRMDRELTLSAYHPDAIDDHGAFVGNPEEFVSWAFDYHGEHQLSHHHMVFNHSVDLQGDVAHTETYWLFFGENRVKPDTLAFGRYIDRFEKRDGKWAIAARVCISEAVNESTPANLPDAWREVLMGNGNRTRDRSDISFDRPLKARDPDRLREYSKG